ncbi:hypothetical protein K432DRAFT_409910 [Lepidopterella palustris CBS 459.81]|uniref:Delta 8-(E)-sphingolipid desaturase n=1 Tax=Lepidopterella palustris CBS 459.81 TaxID=1314670 RepID=A0A8E2DZ69_9PEZI|nr:hypothetical protein K432DRAFT_409910 [Lepidopterella palustris CBS 459.81]
MTLKRNERKITIKELEAANTARKPWAAVRGNVYDLTKFIDKHPGGKDFLLAAVGRDATALYESLHSDTNTKVLAKYKIGILLETNMPQYAKKSKFTNDLEKRVLAYFASIGRNPRDAPWMLLAYGILTAAFAVTYYGMFSQSVAQYSPILPWVAAVLNGWSAAMTGFYLLHDSCHASFTRKPWVWQAMRRVYESITGLSTLVWIYQHSLGHHSFTNVVGADPDVVDENPGILRVHDGQQWWSFYGLQRYYWFPLYTQLILSRKLTEWKCLFYDRRFKHIKINPPQTSEYFWCTTVMTVYSIHHFVLPYTYFNHSILRILALHTVTDIAWSTYLTLIVNASHINSEVAWPKADSQGKISEDWAVLQIKSSLDFAHGDPWTTWLCGGLNYQAVHHMFPYVSQYYYPEIADIVKDTCKDYGVPYHIKSSIWTALGGHLGHLSLFGEKPVSS